MSKLDAICYVTIVIATLVEMIAVYGIVVGIL